jgi:hypothetical protein
MPAVIRIKTAKIPFALATPERPLVEADRGVPSPAVAEIALHLPAPPNVRVVITSFPVRERLRQRSAGQNCRDKNG